MFLLQRLAPHLLLAVSLFAISAIASAAPSVPVNFAASDGDFSDKVQLTWDDVADEDYYEVLVCGGSCSSIQQVATNVTSFDYLAAIPGQSQSFAVRACYNGDDCSADSTRDVGFASNGSAPPAFSIGSASGAPGSNVNLDLEFTAGWVGMAETTVTVTWPAGPGSEQLATVFCDVTNQTVTIGIKSCNNLANGFSLEFSGFLNMTTGLAGELEIGIPINAPSSTQLTVTVESVTNDLGLEMPTDYVAVSAGTITTLATGVSADERAALVNFYAATNGNSWDFKDSWLSGDPCVDNWYKVVCDNNNTMVTGLDLPDNLLGGSIIFDSPNLADLSNLTIFNVSQNSISGQVPVELGSLQDLELLTLNGNQFSGEVPSQLINLTSLTDAGGLDINYNRLSTTNTALDTFLNTKSADDWSATQTIAPTGLQASGSDGTANLTFDVVEFSTGPGRYTLRYSTNSGSGPYTIAGSTDDKSENYFQVTGLSNGVTYYFQVRTESDDDVNNDANLVSEYSAEASLVMGTSQEEIFSNSFE